jgi:hypothetical protein
MQRDSCSFNRRPAVLAAVAALAGGMSLAAADVDISSQPPTLTVFLRGGCDCAKESLEAMKEEAGSILEEAGLVTDWRPMEESHGMEPVPALVVVSLKGKCSLTDPCPPTAHGPFGWTHITDNEILPFCDIDCDRVRSIMGSSLRCLSRAQQHRIFGRALGRVLAHELYHILAGTREHARTGVAKAYLSVRELLFDPIGLSDKEIHRIHGGKFRHLFVTQGQTTDAGAVGTGQ